MKPIVCGRLLNLARVNQLGCGNSSGRLPNLLNLYSKIYGGNFFWAIASYCGFMNCGWIYSGRPAESTEARACRLFILQRLFKNS